MKKTVFLFIILACAATAKAQDTTQNVIDKTKIQLKITDARSKLYAGNVRGALNLFREVLVVDKDHAGGNYGIAECYYGLKDYDNAKSHIEKAYDRNPEVDRDIELIYGMILHQHGDIDDAMTHYKKYYEQYKKKKRILEDTGIETLIAQCQYAIDNKTNLMDVKIANLGGRINTAYPEFAPCISPDGKSLILTSRRGDTKGGGLDLNSDHQYFSDIYVSQWNEEEQTWDEAERLPGKVNTEYHDGALGFTNKGELLIYRNIMNVTRSGDIYYSKQSSSSGKWGSPKEMLEKAEMNKVLNSSYFESSASMTGDGKELYFVSDRPKKALGMADIYVMRKKGRTWSEPENLGKKINTSGDEKMVYIHPSGKFLFYATNGREDGYGSYDLYYCVREESGKWSEPKNMGAPINTVMEEKTISISSDGKTAYVSAYYAKNNRGDADIYKIDVSHLEIPAYVPESE